MFIPDPNLSISDPGSEKFPDPRQRIFLQLFSQKAVAKLSEIGSGMNIPRFWIRILPIPDPVV